MSHIEPTIETRGRTKVAKPRTPLRRLLRACAWAFGGMAVLGLLAIALLFAFLDRVPKSYPPATRPIPPPTTRTNLGGGLDGFNSPYLGHTGSWNGKGGAIGGAAKTPDMEEERQMGLRWTFMPVHWRALEPNGPVDLSREEPAAWKALDAFVVAARERGLNVLMQAPVVGGNAGGPPAWAGRREKGKSAPANMQALVDFAAKLADRYRPGGALARREGWGESYGVRAWEMDNEPEGYLTNWKGQAADYAEFVTLAAGRIKAADPWAVIVAPGLAGGKDGPRWLEAALDAGSLAGSPAFRAQATPYSIGPAVDVVSLHNYEGLDSAFTGGPRTIGQVLDDVSDVLERWEQRTPAFSYSRKQEYWHTEGNFDFIGALSAERRAAWRMQFFTRAFAAGLRKVCVMDASGPEQIAVRAYVQALPWPFPMEAAHRDVKVLNGSAAAFRHVDEGETGSVWVLWAIAKTGEAAVEIPVRRERVEVVSVDGRTKVLTATGGWVRVDLKGDIKMAAPTIVVDR